MKDEKFKKPDPIVIGAIGKLRVVKIDEKGAPLLEFPSGTMMGARKIKDVLAASDACKLFLAQYDVPKATNVVSLADVKTKEDVATAIAALQAKLNAMTETKNGRVDPVASKVA